MQQMLPQALSLGGAAVREEGGLNVCAYFLSLDLLLKRNLVEGEEGNERHVSGMNYLF